MISVFGITDKGVLRQNNQDACASAVLGPKRAWGVVCDGMGGANAGDIASKMAVETCIWPLYEVIDGRWYLSYVPRKKLPVEEFMKLQGRFRHCFKPGNEWTIAAAQEWVDERWEKLQNKCE